MRISHTIKGQIKVKSSFENLEKKLLGAQVQAVKESTLLLHGKAVKIIREKSSGKKQTRYNPKRTVTASAPGKSPNTDTGRLIQSIQFDFSSDGFKGMVGTNLRYGAYLELGTKDMERRPWLSTAVQESKKEISKIFKKALSQGISKSKGGS